MKQVSKREKIFSASGMEKMRQVAEPTGWASCSRMREVIRVKSPACLALEKQAPGPAQDGLSPRHTPVLWFRPTVPVPTHQWRPQPKSTRLENLVTVLLSSPCDLSWNVHLWKAIKPLKTKKRACTLFGSCPRESFFPVNFFLLNFKQAPWDWQPGNQKAAEACPGFTPWTWPHGPSPWTFQWADSFTTSSAFFPIKFLENQSRPRRVSFLLILLS